MFNRLTVFYHFLDQLVDLYFVELLLKETKLICLELNKCYWDILVSNNVNMLKPERIWN